MECLRITNGAAVCGQSQLACLCVSPFRGEGGAGAISVTAPGRTEGKSIRCKDNDFPRFVFSFNKYMHEYR